MIKTPTLDKRIASALNTPEADKAELIVLASEAEDAIAQAKRAIEDESERALDLNYDDPDNRMI